MFTSVPLRKSIDFAGQKLTLETGLLAHQATASVLATIGETTVMANVVVGKADLKSSYFPLQVIYEEKMYASGKIRGSRFEKREGRPSDGAVLAGRAIDRSVRSIFDEDFRNSLQVIVTVLSVDEINTPDTLGILAASTALSMATKDFDRPLSGIRIGLQKENAQQNKTNNLDEINLTENLNQTQKSSDQKILINPSYTQIEVSDLDLVVSGDGDSIMMVEAGGNIISEEKMSIYLESACQNLKILTDFQNDFVENTKALGLAKQMSLIKAEVDDNYFEYWVNFRRQIETILYSDHDKETKTAELNTYEKHHRQALELAKKYRTTLNQDFRTKLEDFDESIAQTILNLIESEKLLWDADDNLFRAFHGYIGQIVKDNILKYEKRIDGRAVDQTRKIECQVDVLPRVHSSSLFSRGETQVMNILTLGTMRDALTLDGMEEFDIEGSKRYLHHYNFPSYSVGETGRYGSPSRREIGHGALAEKALQNVIPQESEFPYTMRLVSECLGSNGSTSMASTCASTLSLMAGGVPIKQPIAGVAMGLMLEIPKNDLADLSNLKLQTDRLNLRILAESDAQFMIDSMNSEVTKYLSFKEYTEIEKAKEHINKCLLQAKNGTGVCLVAETKDNQKVGLFSVGSLDTITPIPGLWLNQDFWGQGYGFEGMNELLNWVKQNYVYDYIKYDVAVENIASQKIVSKCGGVLIKDNFEKFYPLQSPGLRKSKRFAIYHPTFTRNFKVLTDIQGFEDHHGDMDFKVTGSKDGITAIQLDNKVSGLTVNILKQALIESKKGRLHILDIMQDCISKPKEKISIYAPGVAQIMVPNNKIGDVIGGGGKIIRGIEERFGTKVDLENETGRTYIYGKSPESVEACKVYIAGLIKDFVVGDNVSARVLRITAFGAFVDMDNTGKEAMIHISKISDRRIERIEDVLKIGDVVPTKVIEVKPNGNIALGVIF